MTEASSRETRLPMTKRAIVLAVARSAFPGGHLVAIPTAARRSTKLLPPAEIKPSMRVAFSRRCRKGNTAHTQIKMPNIAHAEYRRKWSQNLVMARPGGVTAFRPLQDDACG